MKKIIVAFLLCFGLGFAAGVADAAPAVKKPVVKAAVTKVVAKPKMREAAERQMLKARRAVKKMTFPKPYSATMKPVVKKAGK